MTATFNVLINGDEPAKNSIGDSNVTELVNANSQQLYTCTDQTSSHITLSTDMSTF